MKEKIVITDIAHWNHPVKIVLKSNHIKIYKVELAAYKSYATFFVDLPEIISDWGGYQYGFYTN